MKPRIQKIIVGGAIIYNRKLLIIQRSKNEKVLPLLWEMPSGKVEFGEEPQNAIIREIKEEVNLDAEILDFPDAFSYMLEKEKETVHSVQINYLVKVSNIKNLKISEEHDAFAWVSFSELDKYNLSSNTKNIIKKLNLSDKN
jgi:8-oxo-dGTP diphosphatase